MEKTRHNLKTYSIITLGLAVLALLDIAFELFFGELSGAEMPEGSPDDTLLITQIFVLVVSALILLPQFYIGIKGIKIAVEPDSSIAHIIWGIILIVFTCVGLISPVISLVQGEGDAFGHISELCSIAVDAFVLFEYVNYARAVRSEFA